MSRVAPRPGTARPARPRPGSSDAEAAERAGLVGEVLRPGRGRRAAGAPARDRRAARCRSRRTPVPSAPVAPIADDGRRGVVTADQVHRDTAPRAGAVPGRQDRREPRGLEADRRRASSADQSPELRSTSAVVPALVRSPTPAPVRWCTSSSGSSSSVRGPRQLGAVVGRQLEDRVERLQLDPGACVELAARRCRSTTLAAPVGAVVAVARRAARRSVAALRRAGRSRRPTCRRRSTRPAPLERGGEARLDLGDEARPVPAQRAVGVDDRLVRVAVDDLDAGGPSPRSTRQTRIDVAPKSTATTAATVDVTGRWRPTPVPALGDLRPRGSPTARNVASGSRAAPLRRRASATSGRTSVRKARCSTSAARRRVVGVLRVGELVAVDAQRLGERDLDRVGGLDQVLERVLEVVALVDHVGEVGHRARRRPRAARAR